MGNLRSGSTLWQTGTDGMTTLAVGAATRYGSPGRSTNIVLFVNSDTSTTISVQVATGAVINAGVNADLSSATWCNYLGFDNIAVTGNTPIAIDLSPFAPQFVRIFNKSGSTITTLTVAMEDNG